MFGILAPHNPPGKHDDDLGRELDTITTRCKTQADIGRRGLAHQARRQPDCDCAGELGEPG